MREDIALSRSERKRTQRLGVAVDDMQSVDDHCRDAWSATVAGPRGDGDLIPRGVMCEDDPENVRGLRRQPMGHARKQLSDVRAVGDRQKECAKASRAGGNACFGYGFIESESAPRLRIEWRWIAVATNRTRDRRQPRRGISRSEKLGGGMQRRDRHAPTLAMRGRISAIVSLPRPSVRMRDQRAKYSRDFHSTRRPRRTAPAAMMNRTPAPSGWSTAYHGGCRSQK